MCPRVHYDKTYAPVDAWGSIMILLYTLLHNNCKNMQLDYVLDFLQATVDRECSMNIPKGIEVQSGTKWLLITKENIYRQCQAGRVWNKFRGKK